MDSKILGEIAEKVGGELKDKVLIENNGNNFMLNAYNDGVNAMACKICDYIATIMVANRGDK